jgi:hypothetical protein
MKTDFDAQWRALSEKVLREMKEWRLGHPRATFSEMETALDEQLDRLRAQMLEDIALAVSLQDIVEKPSTLTTESTFKTS